MVLDTTLLNTQYYKVRIKGSGAIRCSSYGKRSFRVALDYGRQLFLLNAGTLGNSEYPDIAIAPRFTLSYFGSTRKGPIYGSNRTKLCTYDKLNCLK